MLKVNAFEAKAKLSEYLDRAVNGERVVICRHNKPVAELRAIEGTRTEPRPLGPLPGRPTFDVPPSFMKPLSDEELAAWEGAADGETDAGTPDARPIRVAEDPAAYRAKPKRRRSRRK